MKLTDLLKAMSDDKADVSALLAGATPEDLAALSAAIVENFQALEEGTITTDTIAKMEALADARDVVVAETGRRDAEAAAAAEKVQQLARRIAGETDGGDDEEGTDGDDATTDDDPTGDDPGTATAQDGGDDDDQDEDGGTEGAPAVQGRELVPASNRRGVNLSAVRAQTGTPRLPARNRGRVSIVAAADLPGIPTGSKIDFERMVAATQARFKGFPQGHRPNTQLKAAIATIERPFPKELIQDTKTDNDDALLASAADQARLPGKSLMASGGWCAPSETVYDLCEPETVDGMVSVPELAIRRGGIRFPVSPLFSDIYTGVGFQQTEAENIAGDEKACYEIGCPSFSEVRLDAIGVCITAGILQQRGYPEMVARVLRGANTAHQHKVNAYVLAKMVALSTAVTPTLAGFGAWADTLSAVELQAVDMRYKYRLSENSPMEMVAPQWLKPIFRADLAVRNATDPNNPASDAQLDAHFRARNVNVQWVKDWQDAYVTSGHTGLGGATAATVWPTTAKVLLYPAGTFTKGVSDVIQLDAIYDSTNIRTNQYTALFTEEGVLVAKRCLESRVVTLTEICPSGRTGAQVAYDCTP